VTIFFCQWDKIDGVALVTDVTDPATFANCSKWLDLVKPCVGNKSEILGVLLANKSDCGEDRAVATSKAQETALSLNLRYFEVTAVRTNSKPVFSSLFNQLSNWQTFINVK